MYKIDQPNTLRLCFVTLFSRKAKLQYYWHKTYAFFLFLSLLVTNAINAQQISIHAQPTAIFHFTHEPFIKNYTNRFKNEIIHLKNKNQDVLNFIEYVLIKNGIPKQLKNLAIIESSLNSKTVSSVGATGPWQFMPSTAQQYGLIINNTIDERYDIYKSTYAAAKYLKQLYQRYKNWNLVVAAYNSGTAPVDKAIKRNNSKSFWDIQYNLPAETRNHVKKFIGTSAILDGTTKNILSTDNNVVKTNSINDKFKVEPIEPGFRLDIMAERLNMTIETLQQLNPDFDHQLFLNASYNLTLPTNKMQEFLLYKAEILNLSIEKSIKM